MDNIQKHNIFIAVPSAQTFRFYPNNCSFELDKIFRIYSVQFTFQNSSNFCSRLTEERKDEFSNLTTTALYGSCLPVESNWKVPMFPNNWRKRNNVRHACDSAALGHHKRALPSAMLVFVVLFVRNSSSATLHSRTVQDSLVGFKPNGNIATLRLNTSDKLFSSIFCVSRREGIKMARDTQKAVQELMRYNLPVFISVVRAV
jgi:hypothetical protein